MVLRFLGRARAFEAISYFCVGGLHRYEVYYSDPRLDANTQRKWRIKQKMRSRLQYIA
jgi:hypothetical protein